MLRRVHGRGRDAPDAISIADRRCVRRPRPVQRPQCEERRRRRSNRDRDRLRLRLRSSGHGQCSALTERRLSELIRDEKRPELLFIGGSRN